MTFFGRDFGVLVLMNSRTKKPVYHQIVKTEKDIYYKVVVNKPREKGYIIQSITCDGRRGLLKGFLNERSEKPNENGYFPFKHRGVGGSYASLKRYGHYLFIFEK